MTDDTMNNSSSALVVPATYKVDHPCLEPLASKTPEYSAPAVKAGSNVSLEDVDNAEKQYKTRRALQLAGLSTMDEVLAAKKREYELLAENAGRVALPEWVATFQRQLQQSVQQEVQQALQQVIPSSSSSPQQQNHQHSSSSTESRLIQQPQQRDPLFISDETHMVKTTTLLENFQEQLQDHALSVQHSLRTVTMQVNEIGQTLIQETVRNMNRTKVKHDSDPLYPLPILDYILDDDISKMGQAKVIYPKDQGVWFPERLCQIKTLKDITYPKYPMATEYQVDRLLQFYNLNVDHQIRQLANLEISESALTKEILRYKQEALYHFLGVEWC